MIEINDFKYNPTLRRLLVNYCIRTYEMDAITDDWHLIQEYNFLKKNNELHFLFDEEYLINYLKDGNDNKG
jgi:hypothetical protein